MISAGRDGTLRHVASDFFDKLGDIRQLDNAPPQEGLSLPAVVGGALITGALWRITSNLMEIERDLARRIKTSKKGEEKE